MTYTLSYFLKGDNPMVYNLLLQKSINGEINRIEDYGSGWHKVSKIIPTEKATSDYKLSLEEVKADLIRIREKALMNTAMEISRKYF